MPLAEARHNNLAVTPKLPLWNGKKPESLLELLGSYPGDRNAIEPLTMSAQQKANSVDLALYRFAQAQTGNRFDPTLSTHPTFIKKSSVRRAIGDYTSAVIEGMVRGLFFCRCMILMALSSVYFQRAFGRQTLRLHGVQFRQN